MTSSPSCTPFLRTARFAAAVAAIQFITNVALAGDITKADNTTSLNQTASWVGGVVPTSADTILVNSTLTASRSAALGADLSVLGINYTATSQFQITNTAGANLTIGAGGISKTGSAALIIASNVTLSANQTWAINTVSGQNLQINGGFADNGYSLAITSNTTGVLDLRSTGNVSFGSTVTIGANISVNSATANVSFGGSNTYDSLAIASGRANVSSIGNFGTASAAGDGGTSTAITLGSTNATAYFDYTGATATSNRTFNVDRRSNGATISNSNSSSTLTINGTVQNSLGNATGEKDVTISLGGEGNLVMNGIISDHSGASNTTSISKFGAGSVTLGASNSYLGTTTIAAGTLGLSASERINNASNLSLAGGTFALNGYTETLGTLSLTGNSVIDLGTGGIAVFSNSSAATWTGGMTLSVLGTFTSGSSLRFGTSAAGLTNTQLSQISISGFSGFGLDGNGFLTATAVPEPSTYALLAGLAGLGLVAYRRRQARLATNITQKL